MQLKFMAGRALEWPTKRLLAARWFPLLRTFNLRKNWLFDLCRFAGTREFEVLFDVGANTGQTTTEFRYFFPRAITHSFEPVRETFLELQNNIRRWPNIRTHQLALGRRSEQRDIVIQDLSLINSLRFVAGSGEAPDAKIERFNVSTIDEFCSTHAIEFIDLLKTDTEGFDLDVIAGSETVLRGNRVAFVYSEVTFQANDQGHSAFAPLNDFLVAHGFRLAGFYEQWGSGPWQRVLGCCNALFFNPEALQRRFPLSANS